MGKLDPTVAEANSRYFREAVQPKVLKALRSNNASKQLANLMEKDPSVARAFQLSPQQTDEWIKEAAKIERLRGKAKGEGIANLAKRIKDEAIRAAVWSTVAGAGYGAYRVLRD